MTQATRNGLIGILDAAAVAEIDQAVMDAYLAPYSSHADYVERATGETVYLAVMATAEYHEHWARLGGATYGPEPHSTFMPFPGGGYPGETDTEYRERIGSAATVTETSLCAACGHPEDEHDFRDGMAECVEDCDCCEFQAVNRG